MYDIAKNLTVLLVVVAHSTRMYTDYGTFSPANSSPLLAAVTEYIYQFHMPLFIFLSGAVYAFCINGGKYADNVAFVKSKAKRLLIPYFIVGFLYVVPVMYALGLVGDNMLNYCYWGILLSWNAVHLWFLEALFWIFLFAMAVKKILILPSKRRLLLLPISAAIFCLKRYVPDIFQLRSACAYQLYFVIGILFHFNYEMIERFFGRFYRFGVALPVVLLGMFWFNPNKISDMLYTFIGMTALGALAMYIAGYKRQILNTVWYQTIKRNAMGIYLFHPMIIYILYYFLGPRNIHPLVLSSSIAIVSIYVSVFLTRLIRMLHLQVLIGE